MVNTETGRILVVDDDPTVAEVVARYLMRDGYDVDCVADGHAALRVAAQSDPDLVVLDLMLPGIDGLEVCRRLRERRPVPIVMLSALGEETDRLVGLETGADDYVTKPFSPRELALRVRSVLAGPSAPWPRPARRSTTATSPSTPPRTRYGSAASPFHSPYGSSTSSPSSCGIRGRRSPAPNCWRRCGAGSSATPRR
jgi:DNA-binding response OmpR family regulator